MYDERVKRLRELASIPKHCENVESCDRCSKEEICLSFTNKRIIEVATQAADAIEELSRDLDSMNEANIALYGALPKWIPVAERLPEECTDVLVVRKFLGVKGQVPPSTYVEIASRIGDDWCSASDEYKIARSKHTDPLFWMPLPEPPKEE